MVAGKSIFAVNARISGSHAKPFSNPGDFSGSAEKEPWHKVTTPQSGEEKP